MYRQTSMNGSHRDGRVDAPASTASVVSNATDILHDVTELAELQIKLFAADIKATSRQSAKHIAVLVLGASGLLGVMPVLLMGVAALLVEEYDLSPAQSLLTSAVGGFGVAGVVIFVGWLGLRRGLAQLNNSNEELARNLAWVKKTLKRGGSAKSPTS